MGEIYKKLKEELVPILHNLFQKIEEKGMFLNSFYEASYSLMPRPGREHQKQ